VKKIVALGKNPLTYVLKRLEIVSEIEDVFCPNTLEDTFAISPLAKHLYKSPCFLHVGSNGEKWLVYLWRYFKKHTPFFLHIGVPIIPQIGLFYENSVSSLKGFLSCPTFSLYKVLSYLSQIESNKKVFPEERDLLFYAIGWGYFLESKRILEHRSRTSLSEIIEKVEKIKKKYHIKNWFEFLYKIKELSQQQEISKTDFIKIESIFKGINKQWDKS